MIRRKKERNMHDRAKGPKKVRVFLCVCVCVGVRGCVRVDYKKVGDLSRKVTVNKSELAT